jgi:hypothetical protein
MGCYCDYDGPQFLVVHYRTARKQHKCCECGHVIELGECYEHVVGKWEEQLSTFDTCELCTELRDALADYYSGCFTYGDLSEEYLDYLQDKLPEQAGALHAAVFYKHRKGKLA